MIEWLGALLFGPGPIIAIQRLLPPDLITFFRAATDFGVTPGILIVLALAFWCRGRRPAYALFGIVILASITNQALWTLVDLPRPDDPRIAVRAETSVSSFPSGHVLTATTTWGLLAAQGGVPWAIPVVVVTLVALARLYLGMHYLVDIVGAVLIGLALLYVHLRVIWPRLERRFGPPHLATRPAGGMPAIGWAPVAGAVTLATVAVQGTSAGPFAVLSSIHPDILEAVGAGSVGVMAGFAEYYHVRYAPCDLSAGRRAGQLAGGLGVLVLVFVAEALLVGLGPIVHVLAGALGAAWVMLLAPMLFIRLGLGRRADPDRASGRSALEAGGAPRQPRQ